MKNKRIQVLQKELKTFLSKVQTLILSGLWGRLDQGIKNSLLRRINQLTHSLKGLLSTRRLKRLVMASGLILGINGMVQAQNFDTLQTNVFGIQPHQGYNIPMFGDMDGDGDLDLMLSGYYDGDIYYYKNVGTPESPAFAVPQVNPFGLIISGPYISLTALSDLDGDGDLDVFVGATEYNSFMVYENVGTPTSPSFGQAEEEPYGYPTTGSGAYLMPIFADLDGDSDLDLFQAGYYSNIQFNENIGTATSPSFGPHQNDPFGLDNPVGEAFKFMTPGDLDGDGDIDMLEGMINAESSYYVNFFYYENIGSPTAPDFETPQMDPFNITAPDSQYILFPTLVDIDNDGDLDLFQGLYGGLAFQENLAIEVSKDPVLPELTCSIFPNPSSDWLNIETSNYDKITSIKVINNMGQIIDQSNYKNEGRVQLDIRTFSKGIYFVEIIAGTKETKKKFVKK